MISRRPDEGTGADLARHDATSADPAAVLPPPTEGRPQADEGEIAPPVEPLTRARPRNRIVGWATDLGPPTTLVLLRHGVTEHTVAKMFSGQGGADPPLSAAGRAQAAAAAEVAVARGDVQAVVSSPLRRCRETAEATATRLGLEVEVDEGFAEAAFGEWDGRTLDEVTERWPDELEAWLGSTAVAPPGGGESLDALAERVQAARDRTIARHAGTTILVATHVNPIKTLVRLAMHAPSDAMHHMLLTPASLSEVRYYGDGTEVLTAFSVTAHLAGVADLDGR